MQGTARARIHGSACDPNPTPIRTRQVTEASDGEKSIESGTLLVFVSHGAFSRVGRRSVSASSHVLSQSVRQFVHHHSWRWNILLWVVAAASSVFVRQKLEW